MTKVTNDPRRVCPTALPAVARAGRCAGLAAAALCLSLGLSAGLLGCGGSRPGTSTGPSVSPSTAKARNTSASKLIERRRAEFKIDHDVYADLGYRLDWRGFPVVQAGERIDFLDVYNDIIVAHESGATISALEASNGALRNSGQVANPLTRFVGNLRVDDDIVVSSDNEIFVFSTATGALTSRSKLSRVVTTHPVYFGGQVVYGTAIGHVYARQVRRPIDAWAFDLGSPIDTDPVLVGSTVAAVSRNGDIAMLDATTGLLVGKAKIYGGCDAAPVAGDAAVFFASLDQSIYAFELDGTLRWRIRTEQPLRVTPTYHNGVLYVPTSDKGLRAVDAITGAELWAQNQVAGRVVGVRQGRLVTWNGRVAKLLDPASGDVVASHELPGVATLRPDRFEDGNLYVVSDGGIIAKFQPRD
ncbi:MAG: PQQ-binding-like beta-propeller repeat protein [Phycisphaerales bacterium JB041]